VTKNELPVPPIARSAKDSKRSSSRLDRKRGLPAAWISDVSVIPKQLVGNTSVRHRAGMLLMRGTNNMGLKFDKTIEEIRKTLNAELSGPTADAKGSFV